MIPDESGKLVWPSGSWLIIEKLLNIIVSFQDGCALGLVYVVLQGLPYFVLMTLNHSSFRFCSLVPYVHAEKNDRLNPCEKCTIHV